MDRKTKLKYLSATEITMEDTPQHIKDLQLKIWLSKPPMERLRQFLVDNEALYMFWNENKKANPAEALPASNASGVKSKIV